MHEPPRHPIDPDAWKSALQADMRRQVARRPWGLALMAIGWVHLAFFVVCQAYYDPKVHTNTIHPVLWVLEFAAVLGTLRLVLGRGWHRSSPGAGIVLRVWITFLILSFNVAAMNTLTGWRLDWFKPVWATLSSFLFATMAWLFGPRFLIPAVQMYFTGLLMIRFPGWNYLIYGLSWWLALHGVGLALERSRRAARGRAPSVHGRAGGPGRLVERPGAVLE